MGWTRPGKETSVIRKQTCAADRQTNYIFLTLNMGLICPAKGLSRDEAGDPGTRLLADAGENAIRQLPTHDSVRGHSHEGQLWSRGGL